MADGSLLLALPKEVADQLKDLPRETREEIEKAYALALLAEIMAAFGGGSAGGAGSSGGGGSTAGGGSGGQGGSGGRNAGGIVRGINLGEILQRVLAQMVRRG